MDISELPQDSAILMSYINTLLRDRYDSLAQLCDDMDIDITALTAKMKEAGFEYNSELNKFW